jgi:FkbM family methyltransferase
MIKKIIKKIFFFFGIQISKLPRKITTKNLSVLKVGQAKIKLNTEHTLPKILEKWPNYSSNLPRIASFIKTKYKDLVLIDIGANVGDTVALIRKKEYFPIICIESDDEYYDLLSQNIKQFKGVSIFKYFLGENLGTIKGSTEKANGTAKIIVAGNNIEIITLDKFIEMHPKSQKAKILKIDTDGYDLKIIRGGLNYIKKTKPILFFEYDEVYLSKNNDDGLSTLKELETIGYNKIIFYDNFGRFLLSTKLKNFKLIEQLHSYIKGKKGAFPYFDLCIFHKTDDDMALECIKNELKFNQNEQNKQ